MTRYAIKPHVTFDLSDLVPVGASGEPGQRALDFSAVLRLHTLHAHSGHFAGC